MKPKPMSEDEIQNAVRYAVTDAVDFIESEVADDRIRAQRYFNGEVDLESEEGRSQVVATKVRDTVRMVKPVLMRTFLQAENPVEFVPRGQEDIQAAEQATKYVSWKFNESDGYSVISDVFHDALIKKAGVAKTWWDETEDVEFDDYSNLTPEQFALVQQDDDVEILEQEEVEDVTPDGMPITLVNAKVAMTKRGGCLKIKSIPPEDFFVDAGATCVADAFVCGDRTEMRVGDLVEMGFDFEEVYSLAGTDEGTIDEEADFERRGYTDEWRDEEINDPSMRKIIVTEAYMRMDVEGTGVPRLYQFILAGPNYKVLDYSLADEKPYSVFEIDPEPHAFFGRSLADIVLNDQTASTSLLRGLIDNVHMSNNPRLVVQTSNGNLEDALNNEIGAVLRANSDPSAAYFPLTIPFTAQQTLPALEYYDREIETKTGVSRSTLGMDADALQSTTAAGVNAAVQAASAAAELMARNLAEGGMRRLFKLMLMMTRQHSEPGEVMRLNGQFIPVDPKSWSASMDLTTNVGLGTGQHDERVATLRETLAHQFSIWQTYGPQNGLVTMTNIRNTLEDILKLSGVHNVDRHFVPMNPELERMIIERARRETQQQTQGSDPNAAFMQAEGLKVQQRESESIRKHQLDLRKLYMEDDRKRDEMEQNAILEAAEKLGEYGIKVDDQRIRQLQAQQRPNPQG
ncbi:hypothetical protein PVV74_17365 [Roseovarius sp. SK2]|uniref:portal protein n=1 Tax=Roseovarius TaxID=74030 RepID=UPI00237A6535|nr:hypothetical protein [Roseovarius sp. SK2]MDD9727233.1 hypothetical protein [Roseovarius sp. SK2]